MPSRASHFAVGRLLCRAARWRTFHCSLPISNRHSIVAVCHALHDVYLSTVKKKSHCARLTRAMRRVVTRRCAIYIVDLSSLSIRWTNEIKREGTRDPSRGWQSGSRSITGKECKKNQNIIFVYSDITWRKYRIKYEGLQTGSRNRTTKSVQMVGIRIEWFSRNV